MQYLEFVGYLETILCAKNIEIYVCKKFDNTKWDLDEIDIGTGINSH